MESRRHEQEMNEDIIVNEWRQVLTPTYPFSLLFLPSLKHFPYHHHYILLASTINPPPFTSIN
jgi:hypothetical protein